MGDQEQRQRQGQASPELALKLEAQLQRLEEIVKGLEGEALLLAEALALFEEGVTLAREIQKALEQSRLRVKQVLSLDEEPQPFEGLE